MAIFMLTTMTTQLITLPPAHACGVKKITTHSPSLSSTSHERGTLPSQTHTHPHLLRLPRWLVISPLPTPPPPPPPPPPKKREKDIQVEEKRDRVTEREISIEHNRGVGKATLHEFQ